MAGDWLKMEIATPDKPEVIGIADMLNIPQAHAMGCLFMVWRWFDQQTLDGNAPFVTLVTVDRITGVTGFGEAMHTVGWIDVQESGGLTIPNFDRHNGKTAKDRANTAKRVKEHKANKAGLAKKGNAEGNDAGNGQSVTSPLPKEEKRREERKPPISPIGEIPPPESNPTDLPEQSAPALPAKAAGPPASQKPKPDPKGHRLPDDWALPAPWGRWAMDEAAEQGVPASADDVRRTADKFADYWRAKGGKDARKTDWQATWRNWWRRDIDDRKGRPNGSKTDVRADTLAALTGASGGQNVLEGQARRVD